MKIVPDALLALHGATADTPAPDQPKDAALDANTMLRGTPDPQASELVPAGVENSSFLGSRWWWSDDTTSSRSDAEELVPAGEGDSSFLRSRWWNDDTTTSSSSCDGQLVHFLRPPDNCPWYCGTACLSYALGTGAICYLYCNDMSRFYDLYGGEFNKNCWAKVEDC